MSTPAQIYSFPRRSRLRIPHLHGAPAAQVVPIKTARPT